MEIIEVSLDNPISVDNESVACIGYFDGVHLGHQVLITKTLALAKEHLIPACVTFDIDPFSLFHPEQEPKHLTTLNDKLKLFKQYGIKRVFLLKFNQAFAQLKPEVFLELLKQMKITQLVCGPDFHFGDKGSGDSEYLEKHFNVNICQELDYQDLKISSSLIKNALFYGDIESANYCLSRSYSFEATVIKGKQQGKGIGFPTANLQVESECVIPLDGVYAGKVLIDNDWYLAMINIGNNPTFNYRTHKSIEAHILDFDQSIYDKKLRVYFTCYLRCEHDFISKERLISQLNKDRDAVRMLEGVYNDEA